MDSEPAESFDAASTLPSSLTWLGLTPCPLLPAGADGEEYRAQIPACVLGLPGLRFLDISGGAGEGRRAGAGKASRGAGMLHGSSCTLLLAALVPSDHCLP